MWEELGYRPLERRVIEPDETNTHSFLRANISATSRVRSRVLPPSRRTSTAFVLHARDCALPASPPRVKDWPSKPERMIYAKAPSC